MMNQQHELNLARYPGFLASATRWQVYANAAPGRLVSFAGFGPKTSSSTRTVHVTGLFADFMIEVPRALGRQMRTAFPGGDGEYDRLRFTLAQCFERAFLATLSYAEFATLNPGASVEQYDEHRDLMARDGSLFMALALRAGLGDDVYFRLLSDIARDVQRAVSLLGFDACS